MSSINERKVTPKTEAKGLYCKYYNDDKERSIEFPGIKVDVAIYDVPRNSIINVTELSNLLITRGHLWSLQGTFNERIHHIFSEYYDEIQATDYFIAPINITKSRGRKDLPTITFCVVLWLLQNYKKNILFIDPVDYEKSEGYVSVSNITRFYKQLSNFDFGKITYTFDGYKEVNNQRNGGEYIGDMKDKISETIGDKVVWWSVKLSNPKYNSVGKINSELLKTIFEDIAYLSLGFVHLSKTSCLNKNEFPSCIYYILDEFSLYAMYTAALIHYANNFITNGNIMILRYFRGQHVVMDTEPEKYENVRPEHEK